MKLSKDNSDFPIHETNADLAFITLFVFLFFLVVVLVSSNFNQIEIQNEIAQLDEKKDSLNNEFELFKDDYLTAKDEYSKIDSILAELESQKKELLEEINDIQAKEKKVSALEYELSLANELSNAFIDQTLESSGLGKKDFDLFIQGLDKLPGKDVHLIVDATGSMNSSTSLLIPILRAILIKSGKELSALTWFANYDARTIEGFQGHIYQRLLSDAPFSGDRENIGKGISTAVNYAKKPGAYLLIGDEPPNDYIDYSEINAPVFCLPFGRLEETTQAFEEIARKTNGISMTLHFQ